MLPENVWPEPVSPCMAAWQTQRHRIHARSVLARIANKCLGIHRAGKMHVQIGALGKIVQKRPQRLRALVQVGLVDQRGACLALVTCLDRSASGRTLPAQLLYRKAEKPSRLRMIAFQCSPGRDLAGARGFGRHIRA